MSEGKSLHLGSQSGVFISPNFIKGGIRIDDIDLSLLNIFKAFDKDNNNVLTDNEVYGLLSEVQAAANPGNKNDKKASIFSYKETKAFLKSNDSLKEIDENTFYYFLCSLELSSATVLSSNTDENNKVVTKYETAEGIVTEILDNNTGVTERTTVQDGKSITVIKKGEDIIKQITLDENSGEKVTISYSKNQPVSRTIENSEEISVYKYLPEVEQDKLRLLEKTDKKTGKKTLYSYTENGIIKTTTNKETISVGEYIKDENKENDYILTKQTTTNGNQTIIKTYDVSSGRAEILQQVEGKNYSQTVRINGEEYKVQYDGFGNTKGIIVQQNESIAQIAQKFGCSITDLKKVNNHLLRGISPDIYFKAGESIVVPGEIKADEFQQLNSSRLSKFEIEQNTRKYNLFDINNSYNVTLENFEIFAYLTEDHSDVKPKTAQDCVKWLYRDEYHWTERKEHSTLKTFEINDKEFNARVKQFMNLNPGVFNPDGTLKDKTKTIEDYQFTVIVTPEYADYYSAYTRGEQDRVKYTIDSELMNDTAKDLFSTTDAQRIQEILRSVNSAQKLKLLDEKILGISSGNRVKSVEQLLFYYFGHSNKMRECLNVLGENNVYQGVRGNKRYVKLILNELKSEVRGVTYQKNVQQILDLVKTPEQKKLLDEMIRNDKSLNSDGLIDYLKNDRYTIHNVSIGTSWTDEEVANMSLPLIKNKVYNYSEQFKKEFPEFVGKSEAEASEIITKCFNSSDNGKREKLSRIIKSDKNSLEYKIYEQLVKDKIISENKTDLSLQSAQRQADLYTKESANDKKVKEDMIKDLEQQLDVAQVLFENQENIDGWSADAANFFKEHYSDVFAFAIVAGSKGEMPLQFEELSDVMRPDTAKSVVTGRLAEFKEFVTMLKNADNSIEGCKKGLDFNTIFKKFTGVDYDPEKIQSFYKAKREYEEKATTVEIRDFINETLDEAFKSAKNHEIYLNTATQGKYGTIHGREKINHDLSLEKVYEAFHSLLGLKREDWEEIKTKAEREGIDFEAELRQYANAIKQSTSFAARQILGGEYTSDDIKRMHNEMNTARNKAFGKNDIIKNLDEYCISQNNGAAVVKGVGQMALWGTAMLATGGGAVVSGLAYSGGYLSMEVSDRVTNDIDDSQDLWNKEVMSDLGYKAGVELLAGYIFETKAVKGFFEGKAIKIYADICKKTQKGQARIGELLKNAEKEGIELTDEKICDTLWGSFVTKGLSSGAKDSTKETFSELLKRHMKGSDILNKMCWGFVLGAVLGPLKWKFGKNANLYKVSDKLTSKVVKKGGSIEVKLLIAGKELSQEQVQELKRQIKETILQEASMQDSSIVDYMKANKDELNAMIEEVLIEIADLNNSKVTQ